MAFSERVCVIPGIQKPSVVPSYDSRGIVVARDFSRESSMAGREGSRDSHFDPMSLSLPSQDPTKPLVFPKEYKDAVITLVRAEQAKLNSELSSKVTLLENTCDYLTSELQEVFKVIPRHAGGQVMDMEVPDALRHMLDKTDYATKTLAVHEARLQESEGFLQELACLQREVAMKVGSPLPEGFEREATSDEVKEQRLNKYESELKTRLDTHMRSGQHGVSDERLRKIESELSELQGQLSRGNTLASNPEQSGFRPIKATPLNPNLHTESSRTSPETRQLGGDHDDLRDDSPDKHAHAQWFAEFIPPPCPPNERQHFSAPASDKAQKAPAPAPAPAPVEPSQIRVEEREAPEEYQTDEAHDPDDHRARNAKSGGYTLPHWMTPWRSKKSKASAVGA